VELTLLIPPLPIEPEALDVELAIPPIPELLDELSEAEPRRGSYAFQSNEQACNDAPTNTPTQTVAIDEKMTRPIRRCWPNRDDVWPSEGKNTIRTS
jgi:hypothetical protein